MAPSINFECYRGEKGLKEIWTQWEKLLPNVEDVCFTHYPGWYAAYMNNLATDPEDFYFICAKKRGHLIAIFPFELKVVKFGFICIYIFSLPRHSDVRMVDFIIIDSHQKELGNLFVDMLWWLKKTLPFFWDIIYLPGVFENGRAIQCLHAQEFYPVFTGSCFKCKIIPVIDEQGLSQRLSKNFRHNLRKARNKLKREGSVKFDSVSDPEGLNKVFREFVALEASGWKGKMGTAIACNASLKGYYQDLLNFFSKTGQAEIAYLKIDDLLVVALFVLKIKKTAYFYKIGYNEMKGYLSPGNLLIEWQLKRYYDEGEIRWVNLITDAPYMDKWKPETRRMCNYFCFNATFKGKFSAYGVKLLFYMKKMIKRI